MPKETDDRQIRFKLPTGQVLPRAEPVNFFYFTFSGTDVQMLTGYVDLLAVHEARTGKSEPEIVPDITHRFALSQIGFAFLRKQVEEIAKLYDAAHKGANAPNK